MKPKLTAQDWLGLIELGITTTTQLLAARAQRKADLAVRSPEFAAMTQAEFDAVFAHYYTAEDRLAAAAAALVESGASEHVGGEV